MFLERLGVAEDNGMDASPDSEGWNIAAAGARRVASGMPPVVSQRLPVGTLDQAIAAFAPYGGLTFICAAAKSGPVVPDDREGSNPQ
ncbi:MAG: hypothetical protein H7210_01785 [Pyrinomonadaceae bacterium]|nr:hypothetical protein [Phycisphaerales bacterium]